MRDLPALTDRAVDAARRAARGETGDLALGFTASLAFNPLVPAAIRDFRAAWPDVRVTLVEANSAQLAAYLAEGDLDVAFLRPGVPGADALHLRALSAEPMVAALPSRDPRADAPAVRLADLAGDPLLLFPRAVGPTLYDTIVDASHRIGVTPRLDQTAPQIASAIHLVAAGMGFAGAREDGGDRRRQGRLSPGRADAAGRAPGARHAAGDTNPIVRRLARLVAVPPPRAA